MPARPPRVKLKSELGFPVTLPEGEEYLELSGRGGGILVTWPGPLPDLCLRHLAGAGRVFLLHAPELDAQMPASWHAAVPDSWEVVSPEKASGLMAGVRVLHYTPASRIFPSLFAPLLARRQPFPAREPLPEIWLPSAPSALVVPELLRAARQLGFCPRILPPEMSSGRMRELLRDGPPRLFLSVNFHGLDAYGEIQALLEAAGAPLAVWCVDNPFHLLTRQKNRLWQRAELFVTDSWFMEPLAALGARAHHLPLATDPEFFAARGPCPEGDGICFVGRTGFPQRDRFFAVCSVPESLLREAEALPGRLAHFGWWRDRWADRPLWPGNSVRSIGFGAERSSVGWRERCLRHLAAQVDLTIVGDAAWKDRVPSARLKKPVDYYAGLADEYRRAPFSLNLTSLLLPHGLTQRHFDVWACGGFLLTDATPGLTLFPPELVREVSFEEPEQAVSLLRRFAGNPRLKEDVRTAWREHILAGHTYVRRLERILEVTAKAAAMPR